MLFICPTNYIYHSLLQSTVRHRSLKYLSPQSSFAYSHPALTRQVSSASRRSTRHLYLSIKNIQCSLCLYLHYIYRDAVSTPQFVSPNGFRCDADQPGQCMN